MKIIRRNVRGFTLIEILVVIAIIGILAAIVLGSLSEARARGNDAKIQEQMNSIRNAAETYYGKHGDYGGAGASATDCQVGDMGVDTESGMANLMTAANWADNVAPTCVNNSDASNPSTAYASWHALTNGTSYWCVDSVGAAKYEASAPGATDTVCP